MQLTNTLTMKKEEVIPHQPGIIKMYTCGPTVYGYAHIGNLRSYLMEDVLEKALRYEGYQVDRAMNITDVGHLTSDADTGEDKMLKGAKREHKSVLELAAFYTEAFFADCQKLNIRRPDIVVPATGCISDFIEMVSALLEKGFAYQAGGNVYFDTSRLETYYVFGNQNAEDLAVGVREGVESDENKRNKTDFVLWFTKSKFEDQELKWESPWGLGYPGWHIECSAISVKHLGEYLDIHCGGIDNAFPHHTNEIAQSEAYLGHPWCAHWFHILHLTDASGKISKSKGAKLTVSLLEEKGYDPLCYRLFCLQSHYRKPLVFSFESLDNAVSAYQKLTARIAALGKDGEPDLEAAKPWQEKFKAALANDLNTSQALTVVYDMLKSDLSDAGKRFLILDFDQVLSLDLLGAADRLAQPAREEVASELAAEIQALIEKRAEAKKARDWATADAIRDELAAKHVVLKDTPQGTEWRLEG
ncbi:cysteine--tRNA ligase [Acutalibacter sp. 1XD8-33]|uniref:cysteine--tRNA ligase n=1 Tax=Acutalibacter sp. 1XD8-33 TaxID=2320081 RepID=UPI000EA13D8D|nr:cysteine--tRNA ligase [Acutalibacter sp. 1XD8-33]RKJ39950.1 cysteine--tRNA ligase [Acutalibacter sp. 1XD8-33]